MINCARGVLSNTDVVANLLCGLDCLGGSGLSGGGSPLSSGGSTLHSSLAGGGHLLCRLCCLASHLAGGASCSLAALLHHPAVCPQAQIEYVAGRSFSTCVVEVAIQRLLQAGIWVLVKLTLVGLCPPPHEAVRHA